MMTLDPASTLLALKEEAVNRLFRFQVMAEFNKKTEMLSSPKISREP